MSEKLYIIGNGFDRAELLLRERFP